MMRRVSKVRKVYINYLDVLLVVDDDQGMREFMEIMLVQEGYNVTSIGEPRKAIELCRKTSFDLIITDLKMPQISGIDFSNLSRIKNQIQ